MIGSYFSSISDLIKHSAPARIVNLSSINHRKGKVDFSHFHGENLTYFMDQVYSHTKIHNLIYTNELARRLQGTGKLKMKSLMIIIWPVSAISLAQNEALQLKVVLFFWVNCKKTQLEECLSLFTLWKYVSVYFCAGVTANSVHPGIVMTEVMRHYPLLLRCLFNIIGIFFFKVSSFVPFRLRSHCTS